MKEESVNNSVTSILDVLKKMDRINESFTYEVWVPSLNKTVMFREINTAQQERLIKSIIDSPVYNTEFIFTLQRIIDENCAEDIDTDAFNIIDKLFIAMKMRSVSIGDSVEMKFPVKGMNEPILRGISIEKIIEQAKQTVNIPKNKIITSDNYTIECSVPTIGTEFNLEKELRSNADTQQAKNVSELRKIVGDAFITEVIKYISKLTISEGEESTIIDMDKLGFKNRITLIGKLPTRILKEIVSYINEIKEEINKITLIKTTVKIKVKEDDIESEKDIDVEERLTIDGGFFTSY